MSKVIETNCLACKNRSDIFNSLASHELEKVDCQRVSIHYNPGEVIFKQGAPCHNFICITSGLVKIYIEHDNSHNIILGLIRPINYIFEPGAFVDQRHHFTAVASEETSACLVDVDIMQSLMRSNPEFATEFIGKISIQAIELFNKISSYTQKHVYGRVADMLLYLTRRVYETNPFDLTISRQDLADLSGMTKESVIRVLKKFKDDNIISLEGNHLEILNLQKLEAISKSG
jgi:CRP/FNR family transcriptional regulator, polysaccharide utilization system transcription regulator